MKSILLTCVLLFNSVFIIAQIKALTENGEEVLLFEDGTWSYLTEKELVEPELMMNEQTFERNTKSTFLVRSNRVDLGVYINPKEWSSTPNSINESAEYQFQLKNGDLYAMMISEQVQIPLETLKGVALNNAKQAAPDAEITKAEYRRVNGLKVMFLEIKGTLQGIKFIYNGYYYSNDSGTVQLISYTGDNLFDKYKSKMEAFLNGFVKQ